MRGDTMNAQKCCEYCSHFVYDEEYGDICEINMDEDEVAREYTHSDYTCPYFHFNNEYETVNKQI